MSQQAIVILGIVGSICGIIAFIWPFCAFVLDRFVRFIFPHSIKLTEYNITTTARQIIYIDFLYNDQRMMILFASISVIQFIFGFIIFFCAAFILLENLIPSVLLAYYVIVQPICYILLVFGLLHMLSARTYLLSVWHARRSAKKYLATINRTANRIGTDFMLELRTEAANLSANGAWNSNRPDFDPGRRGEALKQLRKISPRLEI